MTAPRPLSRKKNATQLHEHTAVSKGLYESPTEDVHVTSCHTQNCACKFQQLDNSSRSYDLKNNTAYLFFVSLNYWAELRDLANNIDKWLRLFEKQSSRQVFTDQLQSI